MKWFDKFKSKAIDAKKRVVHSIFGKGFDSATLRELESILIKADLGIEITADILSSIKREKNIGDEDAVDISIAQQKARDLILPLLMKNAIKWTPSDKKMHIIIFSGVNGSGKTTTIGKFAKLLRNNGKKVLIVACDTFRAAAVDQLRIWAQRAEVDFFDGAIGADPASVAFSGISKADKDGYDIVLVDTAGRLHNNDNLMQELCKIQRVIAKSAPNACNDVFLVIDAGIGQNALSQVNVFHHNIGITGLVITKLDSTAKGGVVVPLAKGFNIPILFTCFGENDDAIEHFDPAQFVDGILGID